MNLTEKYHPTHMSEVVLPVGHCLGPLLRFMAAPCASAWLLKGGSGLGKTSVAMIMARNVAEPAYIDRVAGIDLDAARVRELEASTLPRPKNGHVLRCVVIDDADGLPADGQMRLLHAMEHSSHILWIFTSNGVESGFDPRLLSRLREAHFTKQGLLESAVPWLLEIARKEGLVLAPAVASRIIVNSKNDLRSSLLKLEMMIAG
jgi:replication-associated recombination protein RarA